MAIRKRGKLGYYSSYFRGLDERPDGSLVAVTREVCLHTADATTAAALDRQLREREAARRASLRARAFARQLLDGGTDVPTAPEIIREHRPKRLRLFDALATAAKYAAIGDTARKVWGKFARAAGVEYMDQVTPEIVHEYLAGYSRGHTANNVRGVINRVFSLTLLDSGLDRSPVVKIPTRRKDSEHQRPLSEDEFLRLYAAAPEPWHTASLIAWHTGLREADVFALRWSFIDGDTITTLPRKTARFGRSVQIPIHPQLADALARLPRANDYVLGQWSPAGRVTPSQRRALAELFAACDIRSDDRGLVKFNSLRDSFITRLDAANIPRHAIRGMVGHTTDDMTDLYSWDLSTARRITALPAPPLPDANRKNTTSNLSLSKSN